MHFSRPERWWSDLPKELDPYNITHWELFAESRYDRRTVGWPLMDSFPSVLLICVAYIALVVCGPALFSRILPRNKIDGSIKDLAFLKPVMIVYNVCVIAFNAALFAGFVYLYMTRPFNWVCNSVDYSDDLALKLVYGYFISKGIDFTDTLFMLLRGKFDQASFLHCYHHCSMFLIWWIGARFVGGGTSVVGPSINSLVHVIMYSYYLAIALKVPVPLFLKKLITKLQIGQLFFVMVYSLVVAESDCKFSSALLYSQAAFLFTLFVLFLRFYIRVYKKNAAAAAAAAAAKEKK